MVLMLRMYGLRVHHAVPIVTSLMLRLEAHSKRGKQLIAMHGDEWYFIRWAGMACFNGDVGIQIQSTDYLHTRNIKEQNDANFTYTWMKG